MVDSTLDAALEYARLGYRVIPLKPGTKVPDLRHWPEEASNDVSRVREYFADSIRRTAAGISPNVGIVTGNGLAVLDIDTNHGGQRPSWAGDTLTVRTPSGGLHLYYAVDRPVPNSVGRIAPGVDVRGERGQVAAPPSVIRSDRYKVWDSTKYLQPDEINSPFRVDEGDGRIRVYDYGEYVFVVDRPIARIDPTLLIPLDLQQDYAGRGGRRFEYREEVPVGERNNYLTSLAGYLFATGEDAESVLDNLQTESDTLGFTPRTGELAAIVQSVSRYHANGPAL